METIPFLWTNDDVSVGKSDQLRRQMNFLSEFGVCGTFFVVPIGGEQSIADDAELLDTIAEGRDQGHEFHQHGTRHTPFECGVPETWMLDFSPEVRRRYDDERLQIEQKHSFESLVRMLEEGRGVWREAFGVDPVGFRPGWGAFCGELYRALDALGYEWVSSRIAGITSWLWNQGEWDAPEGLRECVEWRPYEIFGTSVWEVPMTGGDYAFHVPHNEEKISAMVDLAMREFEFCREQGVPFVMVSHWHGLARNEDSGYAVHRKLLPKILESGYARPVTISQMLQEQSGTK
ncbi:MAG: polysaccharide deacetylase family protein [Candidatus Brocadiia bacterium]